MAGEITIKIPGDGAFAIIYYYYGFSDADCTVYNWKISTLTPG
jgi:hypothetical protein